MGMKSMFRKLLLVWASLLTIIGSSKKSDQEMDNDAVRFPELSGQNVVEDYEMAAYHQQA